MKQINKEWLATLYWENGESTHTIARELGTFSMTIQRLMKKFNIPRRGRNDRTSRNNPSQATIAAMHRANVGRKPSLKTRKLLASRGRERKHTQEEIQKMSYAHRKEKNPNWKGGKKRDHGYIFILLPNGKRRAEHRIILENKLGRSLEEKEIAHHIDLNRANNDPDNLTLFDNRGDHRHYHRRLEQYFD